jgi:polyphosphate glucokinase
MERYILGVDVGGTGIKGGVVDVVEGKLVEDRKRLLTPKPATPESVAKTFAELVRMHDWKGPVAAGFPAVVKNGICMTASNIDKSWIGLSIEKIFSDACGCPVVAVNDADAAGLAMMKLGIGKGRKGLVIVLTIGTGIGSAMFFNGQLIANTELGHLEFKGDIAERYCSNIVREKGDLSWEVWATRLNEYLEHLNALFSPDCFILGGGVTKEFERYSQYLTVDVELHAAELKNAAGTIGASLYAADFFKK